MIVDTLGGHLRIVQEVPCDDDVNQTTPVTAGRIEMTPAGGIDVPGGKRFTLVRANVVFAPFALHASCDGLGESREYGEVGVQLAIAGPFTAVPFVGGVFAVDIPKEEFLLYEAAVVDGELETGYRDPSQDVTGTIDYLAGRVQMRVVLGTDIHFTAGCAFGACVIDEQGAGTLTAALSGNVKFPDVDLDGVPDGADNCPLVANPDQAPVATPLVRGPANVTVASCLEDRLGRPTAADLCDGFPRPSPTTRRTRWRAEPTS